MKRWILAKNNDGVVRGVYLRDIPSIIARAAAEEIHDWWDENCGNVFWFTAGMAVMSVVMLCV